MSYTGQTAHHLLMLGLVRASQELVERPGDQATVESELRFYITGEGANEVPHGFMVSGGEPVIPGPNYGDVSSNKNLSGKIAGGDGQGGGETEKLINGEFFGGKQGILQDALPIDLVYYWIGRLAEEATDGNTPTISTATDPVVGIGTVRVDAAGRDYRQLLQKFLSGAVSLSQGTNDYFQTDWANALAQEGDKNFTEGEHNFDEAFGYYGAARDQNEYTDDEAAAKGGREDWSGGYHDTNEDGNIDIRSEFVLGHAQNCAKRESRIFGRDRLFEGSDGCLPTWTADRQQCFHSGILHRRRNSRARTPSRDCRTSVGEVHCRYRDSLYQRCHVGHGQLHRAEFRGSRQLPGSC